MLQAINIGLAVAGLASALQDFQQVLDGGSNACNYPHYTALGDSFACGYGSKQRLRICKDGDDPYSTSCTFGDCGKDLGAYSAQFAAKHGVSSFQYLACSGTATNDVLKYQVEDKSFGQPDLVTINVGGDDESFFRSVMLECMFKFANFDPALCDAAMKRGEDIINKDIPTRLAKLFKAIKGKAPNARTIVMSYAQFWGNVDTTQCTWPLNQASPDQKRRMNAMAKNLNSKLRDAASNAGLLFGDVDPTFEGHRICDKIGSDSFVSWFQMSVHCGNDTGGNPYCEPSLAHPILDAQNAYLAVLEKTLGC